MSLVPYNTTALRTWRQREIRLRERIKGALVEGVSQTLLDMNQMWRFEEIDAPILMPRSDFSCAYDDSDVFVLQGDLAGEQYALRAETTPGSYAAAVELFKTTNAKPPFCVYAQGLSFRQEKSDGATAAKLRFNAFYQLEFQCIYAEGTKAPIAETVRDALVPLVRQITGLETRLIPSDRLPSYSKETIDIEVLRQSPTQDEPEWKEVASTSLRTDFPVIAGQKPCEVFEVAFGLDRMVVVTQGAL